MNLKSENLYKQIGDKMSNLQRVSVRERSSAKIAKRCIDYPVQIVADPVILLERTERDRIYSFIPKLIDTSVVNYNEVDGRIELIREKLLIYLRENLNAAYQQKMQLEQERKEHGRQVEDSD